MRILAVTAKLIALALFLAPACVAAPPASDDFDVAALKSDFDDLYSGLRAAHFDLYGHRPKKEYDALYRSMRRAIQSPMARTDAQIFFQKFVAYDNVAHANIAFPSDAYEAFRVSGGKAFPLSIRYIGNQLFVAADLSGVTPGVSGSRILAINGERPESVEKRLRTNLSADNDYLAKTMLEFRFGQLLWLEFGPLEKFNVEIEMPEGERRSVVIPARSREEASKATADHVFELDWNERRYEITDGVGYLRPGPFYNNAPDAADMWDATAFKTFVDNAFADFAANDVAAVLIDLRTNPGGDNSFSDHLVAWFADRPFKFASHFYVKVSEAAIASNAKRLDSNDPDAISNRFAAAYAKAKIGDIIDFDLGEKAPRTGERYHGKVFLLIDRHSYSNTVTVAALAQDYGFATILGEETSDLATTYGAMEQFTLKNTGIDVAFPKAHIIRPSGGTKARGVIPDIAIASPLRAARDDMRTEAMEIIQGSLAREN